MSYDPDSLSSRDPELIETLLPLVRAFNEHYVRLEVSGTEKIPERRALVVSNHNGGISGPDMLCTLSTLWNTLGTRAPVYALAHDFAMTQFTPIGRLVQRIGAVRASPTNAARILEQEGLALVYPGGDQETFRHSSRRNEIVLGERTGFVRVAQAQGVPIVPIVAHGAHRSAWIFAEGKRIARHVALQRWARVDRFPFALSLPWGLTIGPWLPYLPLPFQVRLRVLDPIDAPAGAEPLEVQRTVRRAMQAALDDLSRSSSGADESGPE